jgi:hypothetical protein
VYKIKHIKNRVFCLLLDEYCVIPCGNVKCRLQSARQMSLNVYIFRHRRDSRIFRISPFYALVLLSIINSSINATGDCFVLGISIPCLLVVAIYALRGFSWSYISLFLNVLLQPRHLNSYIPLLLIPVYCNPFCLSRGRSIPYCYSASL